MFVSPQGKEFETRLKEKKPGDLSEELRIALGMPVGPVRLHSSQFCSQNRTLRRGFRLVWSDVVCVEAAVF